jgi:hypothetical protein
MGLRHNDEFALLGRAERAPGACSVSSGASCVTTRSRRTRGCLLVIVAATLTDAGDRIPGEGYV